MRQLARRALSCRPPQQVLLGHDRMALPVDAEVAGPAILTQVDTTTYIEPGFRALVHSTGNVIIEALP